MSNNWSLPTLSQISFSDISSSASTLTPESTTPGITRKEVNELIEKLEERVQNVERKNEELENLVENLRINNERIERENELMKVELEKKIIIQARARQKIVVYTEEQKEELERMRKELGAIGGAGHFFENDKEIKYGGPRNEMTESKIRNVLQIVSLGERKINFKDKGLFTIASENY